MQITLMYFVTGSIFFKLKLQLLSIHIKRILSFIFTFFSIFEITNKLANNLINFMSLIQALYSKFFSTRPI